eukprot:TRINITY_DN2472_c0_g1_i1.p2 TRINITY_DN2472_c0_g1~~TRINITY_DN2472_c0_g1_i1.p2  ORF type:complete len:303 (-),score=73.20 TRINITY_DN2472_c0_g1_i1:1210-2118(-)
MGNVHASEDAQRYRDGYPGKRDNPKLTTNLDFYSNKIASKPEGDTIENIHKKWFGNYSLLEVHHGYIQWLFPIREDGLNHYAEQLQLHEAKAIREDPVLTNRVIRSYEMMLDFYGMRLVDRTTGQIERASNYRDRYQHLNRSFHNYLRITRILKFLGEVGLEHYKINFVMHVLHEIYEEGQLKNCRESCIRYWGPVLRNEADRHRAVDFIQQKEGTGSSDTSGPARNAARPRASPDRAEERNPKKANAARDSSDEEYSEEVSEEDSQSTQPMDDVAKKTKNTENEDKNADNQSEEKSEKKEL